MDNNWNLQDAIAFCREQGAPQNQQALIALLREIQTKNSGLIPADALGEISSQLALKEALLLAIIKRCPGLRTEEAPHRLELCGGERCRKRNCRELQRFVEENYQVEPGKVSQVGRFSYKITGCMKNCPKGPSLKWDGKLYSNANSKLIQTLVGK